MFELPLFPLNNVLFPGMPLSLHIFEERYKLMINTCIETREPFGVVLISNAVADTNRRAEPYMVGCTAQITQVQPLKQGRMNITAVGRERFQIISLNHDKPYLSGIVEDYPLESDDPTIIRKSARILRGHITRYLEILERAGQIQLGNKQLPHDPMALAYLGAVLLKNIPQSQKQVFLETEHTSKLLDDLRDFYRREVTLLDTLLSPPEDNNFKGLFSLN